MTRKPLYLFSASRARRVGSIFITICCTSNPSEVLVPILEIGLGAKNGDKLSWSRSLLL